MPANFVKEIKTYGISIARGLDNFPREFSLESDAKYVWRQEPERDQEAELTHEPGEIEYVRTFNISATETSPAAKLRFFFMKLNLASIFIDLKQCVIRILIFNDFFSD